MNPQEQIKKAEDYQLQALIKEYTKFHHLSVTKLSAELLSQNIKLARDECKKRKIEHD